jgi:flagellar biosynthesis chaperone FliJ
MLAAGFGAPMTTVTAVTAMTLRAKLEIAAVLLALAGAGFGFRTWLQEHDDKLRAQASIAAAEKSSDQAAAQIKQLVDADKERDANNAAAMAKVAAAAAAQKTPQQIVKWIPEQIPGLPQPIQSAIPAATPENPNPAAEFTVPQADLDALRDQIATCQKDVLALPGAQQDLTSCQAQAKLAGQQLAAAEQERDAYKMELKGGTFWSRAKRGAKWFFIGAAIGVAAACGSGHCK